MGFTGSYASYTDTSNKILYGLPVPVNKLADISSLWEAIAPHGATVRILIDHPGQIAAIEEFERAQQGTRRWSAFVKIDAGGK